MHHLKLTQEPLCIHRVPTRLGYEPLQYLGPWAYPITLVLQDACLIALLSRRRVASHALPLAVTRIRGVMHNHLATASCFPAESSRLWPRFSVPASRPPTSSWGLIP